MACTQRLGAVYKDGEPIPNWRALIGLVVARPFLLHSL